MEPNPRRKHFFCLVAVGIAFACLYLISPSVAVTTLLFLGALLYGRHVYRDVTGPYVNFRQIDRSPQPGPPVLPPARTPTVHHRTPGGLL